MDFASRIDASRLVPSASATQVDANVGYYDGSIGYFVLATEPTQLIAGLCSDPTCGMTTITSTVSVIFPTEKAIAACNADPSTVRGAILTVSLILEL